MQSMSQDVPEHDRSCFCENCWWFKLENPEIVTDIINDYREYAEDIFKGNKVNNPWLNIRRE